jgi:large subunit ribosomal protein L29
MKAKEIRSMSKDDLKAKLEELKKELIKINAQISTGTTPKSPGQVKQVKKNIARILTIINEKSQEVKGTKKVVSGASKNSEAREIGEKSISGASSKNSEVSKKT